MAPQVSSCEGESGGDFYTALEVVDNKFAQLRSCEEAQAGCGYLEGLLLEAGKELKKILGNPKAFNGGGRLLMEKLKLWMGEVQSLEKKSPIENPEVLHLFSEFHEYSFDEVSVNSIRAEVSARLADAQGVITSLREAKAEGGAYSLESEKAVIQLKSLNKILAGMLDKLGISPADKQLVLSAGGLLLSCIKQVRHGGREDMISAFSRGSEIPKEATIQ
ncbi:MAG: hypothetical protein PHO48_02505 [Candidatus Gracilibacteria bacterium]|nr:hypothetical protein [Candidatus Gracilibacteria bacterium]MDD5179408.1 hypothetical protein [Candidatus Gracilibacteria bacterium]